MSQSGHSVVFWCVLRLSPIEIRAGLLFCRSVGCSMFRRSLLYRSSATLDVLLDAVALQSAAAHAVAFGALPSPDSKELSESRVAAQAAIREVLSSVENGDEIGLALEGRDLSDMDLSHLRKPILVSFRRCDLSRAHLDKTTFRSPAAFDSSICRRASMIEAQFHGVTFAAADVQSCDLRLARFKSCIFDRCDFRRCDMRGATFAQCRFTQCDFSESTLDKDTAFIFPEDWHACRRFDLVGVKEPYVVCEPGFDTLAHQPRAKPFRRVQVSNQPNRWGRGM